MIYDCFLIHNELELAELRMMELEHVVDRFVACEATHTFTGKPKKTHFCDNIERFGPWMDRIIPLVYDRPPDPDPWKNEFAQRDYFETVIPSDDSLVLLSDVDEIPAPDKIPLDVPSRPMVFEQQLFYYYVNCRQEQPWYGTIVGSGAEMQHFSEIRKKRVFLPRIERAGWHFSFLGGADKIREKLASYAETDTNTPEIRDHAHIRRCMDTGADLFGRDDPLFAKNFVKIDGGLPFPKALPRWLEKYPHMVK